MSAGLSRAVEFIRSHQNADGGWGYGPGRMSLVEPTAFCLLALDAGGEAAGTEAGLKFLRSCQKETGGLGIDAQALEPSWMSYAALLAFHALGASAEERRLKDWILSFEDASGSYKPEDVKAITEAYRFDASIKGWPWTPKTTGWVEPTALFVWALLRAGAPASEKRVRSGVDLLLDRGVPSGGWNFGNPYAKSRPLEASLLPTALALVALGAAAVPEGRPIIGAGLRYLSRSLSAEAGTVSLAWALLALKSFPSGAAQAVSAAGRLAGLQAADGSFRENLFETSLAFLILSGARILGPGRGNGR